jgi:hypothetical protein
MYEEQIKRLTEHPELISEEYNSAVGIFGYLGPFTNQTGCILQVKLHKFLVAKNAIGQLMKDFTAQIRSNGALPHPEKIGVEHLPIILEVRQRYDKLKSKLIEKEK